MAAEPRESDVTALEKLAAELTGRGLDPVITTIVGGRPVLTVSNPRVTALHENIMVSDGWYWWSWAERITAVGDVSEAADAIARVLAAGAPAT
jgi:hypothetical protein